MREPDNGMLAPPCSIVAIARTWPVVPEATQEPPRSWSVTGPVTRWFRQSTIFGYPGPLAGPAAAPASSGKGCAAAAPKMDARRVVLSRSAFAGGFCSRAGGVGCQPRPRWNSLGASSRASHLAPEAAISACSQVISRTAMVRFFPDIVIKTDHSLADLRCMSR